jgi:release factor glutamine methyltransferase
LRTPGEVAAALRTAGCVFAEDEAALLLAAPGPLEPLLARRVAGEPLEQVLGWAAFDGLRIGVRPGVFVPRRRSELLVRRAAHGVRAGQVVVDLCCGSGALAAAMRRRVPGIVVHAADLDPRAVDCARANLPGARVWQGDLWDALPARLHGRIRVVLANAPYVPSGSIALMPSEARDHEPRSTLDGGDDGLAVHRRIAGAAAEWLAPGGRLLIEVSDAQVPAALDLFARAGLLPRVHTDDELDATAVVGTAPVPR